MKRSKDLIGLFYIGFQERERESVDDDQILIVFVFVTSCVPSLPFVSLIMICVLK